VTVAKHDQILSRARSRSRWAASTVDRTAGRPVHAVLSGSPENACRPAAEVLFRASAAVYGAGTLAVVLTGMGYDGLKGCKALHALGARIIVRTRQQCRQGMPGAVCGRLATREAAPAADRPEIVRHVPRGCGDNGF
jgi:two-component system chemotaxis response regulator CheB